MFYLKNSPTHDNYTLSLHDALPICRAVGSSKGTDALQSTYGDSWVYEATTDIFSDRDRDGYFSYLRVQFDARSEEHTSELQSQSNLVCRLLLEKKKKYIKNTTIYTQ